MIYRYEGQIEVKEQLFAKVTMPGRGETLKIPVGLVPERAVPGDIISVYSEIAETPPDYMFIDRIEKTNFGDPSMQKLAVCFFMTAAEAGKIIYPAGQIPRAKEGRYFRVRMTYDQEKTEQERERITDLQDDLIEKP